MLHQACQSAADEHDSPEVCMAAKTLIIGIKAWISNTWDRRGVQHGCWFCWRPLCSRGCGLAQGITKAGAGGGPTVENLPLGALGFGREGAAHTTPALLLGCCRTTNKRWRRHRWQVLLTTWHRYKYTNTTKRVCIWKIWGDPTLKKNLKSLNIYCE